jgi:hypothetical protein
MLNTQGKTVDAVLVVASSRSLPAIHWGINLGVCWPLRARWLATCVMFGDV